jgi:SAM-dependent methyltransferase
MSEPGGDRVTRTDRTATLNQLVPEFLKPLLRPFYRAAMFSYGRLTHRPKSRAELHDYWRNPPDAGNFPSDYIDGGDRSPYLVDLVQRYVGEAGRETRILEIGCNVGRNLEALRAAGFAHLTGIEINANALALLRERFPDLGKTAELRNEPVEDAIRKIDDGEFDVVYTMAVLEHIHSDSEWVFAEIARVTRRVLITIEDEQGFSARHFPRSYDRVFTRLGMEQIESRECTDIEGLGGGFYARVFRSSRGAKPR